MTIEDLLAKQEIVELSGTYMHGLDRLHRESLRGVFHDDATTDYGFFQGGPDDFVDMAFGALSDHDDNHHMLGQINVRLIEGEDGSAKIQMRLDLGVLQGKQFASATESGGDLVEDQQHIKGITKGPELAQVVR